MISSLIFVLIVLDVGLLGVVIFLGRKKIDNEALITQLTEERNFLTELKQSVKEDIEAMQAQNRSILKQVSELAAEAEMEVKSGGDTLAKEIEGLVDGLSSKIDSPIKTLAKRQSLVEKTLRKAEKERQLLNKSMQRAELLLKFFDDKAPYETVVQELKDRKYRDARLLLAKGLTCEVVAQEVGLPTSEVNLLADIS